MTGLLVVVPVIMQSTADVCLNSMLAEGSSSGFTRDDVLVVDNSRDGFAEQRYGLRTHRDPDGHNIGVARAWNVAAREVLDRGLDYLVICSASMLWGPELHCTWRWQMNEFWGAKVIEADGHSHHLIAWHRSVFEKIGLWDGNFWPAYHEATDFGTRMRLVGWEQGFTRCWVNALSTGVAAHAHLVACPADPLLAYYESKWGGPKGEERWMQPFGTKPMDYWEDVPIPEMAERYGYGPRYGGWW